MTRRIRKAALKTSPAPCPAYLVKEGEADVHYVCVTPRPHRGGHMTFIEGDTWVWVA